jgi:UDPglucose 6-dehydrogenase
MREAPSIDIIKGLLARGARVHAFDPKARDTARRIFKSRIRYAAHAYQALRGADALVLVTEWNEFREPDFDRMKKLMKQPVIVDGRNIYTPRQIRAAGFTYYSIGRP